MNVSITTIDNTVCDAFIRELDYFGFTELNTDYFPSAVGTSVTERHAVFSRFGRSEVNVLFGIVPNGLIAAEVAARRRNLVSSLGQLADSFGGEAGFKLHSPTAGVGWLTGRL